MVFTKLQCKTQTEGWQREREGEKQQRGTRTVPAFALSENSSLATMADYGIYFRSTDVEAYAGYSDAYFWCAASPSLSDPTDATSLPLYHSVRWEDNYTSDFVAIQSASTLHLEVAWDLLDQKEAEHCPFKPWPVFGSILKHRHSSPCTKHVKFDRAFFYDIDDFHNRDPFLVKHIEDEFSRWAVLGRVESAPLSLQAVLSCPLPIQDNFSQCIDPSLPEWSQNCHADEVDVNLSPFNQTLKVLNDITNVLPHAGPTNRTVEELNFSAQASVKPWNDENLCQVRLTKDLSDATSLMQLGVHQDDQLRHSPFTDAQDSLMQAFRDGHAQPDEQVSSSEGASPDPESDGYEPSLASGNIEPHPPAESNDRQEVMLYHLHEPPVRAMLLWTSYEPMMQEIALHFRRPRDQIVDSYELAVSLPDLPEGAVAAIVHIVHDIPQGHDMRLLLYDVAFHGHKSERNFRIGPAIDRQVIRTPVSVTRQDILTIVQADRYCQLEGDRCLVHLNHVRWPDYDLGRRTVSSGDYVKVAIPPSEHYSCQTERLVGLVQDGLSHAEILDNVLVDDINEGFSPDMLDEHEVRALSRHTSGHMQNGSDEGNADPASLLQLSSAPQDSDMIFESADDPPLVKCSFTDQFLASVQAARDAADAEPNGPREEESGEPSIFVQEITALWEEAIAQGRFSTDQPVRVESWYTDHAKHTRCHNSRITLLLSDASLWERQLLSTWDDRAIENAQTEMAIVYPPTEDIAVNVLAQIVIVQRPQFDYRSLVLSVYDSDPEQEHPHTFALVLYERISLESVLEDIRYTNLCPPHRPQNECLIWFGSYLIRDGQAVHLRHGNALRLYIRRGTLVELGDLHAMTDIRLRWTLQNAIWGEIYVRPAYPVVSGEALTLQNFNFTAPAASSAVPPPRDTRPQWIQDLHEIFVTNSFTEMAEEGPVIYVQVWYLHGLRRERCNAPHTVRLGPDVYDWRTDLVFPWRTDVERGVPADFFVVRPMPPAQPWQNIQAHVLMVQAIQSEQSAVILSVIEPATDTTLVNHVASVIPRQVTPADIFAVSGRSGSQHSTHSVRRGHRLFHAGQMIQVHTGESLVVTLYALVDPGSVASQPVSEFQTSGAEFSTSMPAEVHVALALVPADGNLPHETPENEESSLMQQQIVGSQLNPQAPEFTPGAQSLPSWTVAIDDIHQVWNDVACSWEFEARSAFFLTWYVAPGVGRMSSLSPKRIMLLPDFWNWKEHLGNLWRDEMDPDVDFNIHLVSPSPRRLEPGIAGHVLLLQHPLEEYSSILIGINDPAIHDGHNFKQALKAMKVPVFCNSSDEGGVGQTVTVQNIQGCEPEPQRQNDSVTVRAHTEQVDMDPSACCTQECDVSSDDRLQDNANTSFLQQQVVAGLKAHGSDGPSVQYSAHTKFAGMQVPQRFAISLYQRIPETNADVDAPLLWPVDRVSSIGQNIHAVSVLMPRCQNMNISVPVGCQDDQVRATIADALKLIEQPSNLFRIEFWRTSWRFLPRHWSVMSYQTPAPGMVIVMGVRYARNAAVPRALMLPADVDLVTLRQTLGVKHGTFIRHNGQVLYQAVNLKAGDVIEFHAAHGVSKMPAFCAKAVQISLEASLPSPPHAFRSADPAWLICDRNSWKQDMVDSASCRFAELPVGINLHPSTFEALHQQESVFDHVPKRIELFVDGSSHGDHAAWAVVAVSFSEYGFVFQGCMAGLVELNPASSHWIGAKDKSSTDAELSAMAIAQTVAVRVSSSFPAVIRPDLSFSRGLAEGFMTSKHDYALPHLVHVLGMFCNSGIQVTEIRGHENDPWNELADRLAKHALKNAMHHGTAPDSILRELVTLSDDLKWSWLHCMPASFAFAMPQKFDDTIWQRNSSCHVLRPPERKPAANLESSAFDFKIASLNVLSIADGHASTQSSGRCARLDQQFHQDGFAVLCLQEARTAEGQRITDHYSIFASGHQICGRAHHYGCEIWLSRMIPLCKLANGRQMYTKDFKIIVLHSSPRCLVLSLSGPAQIVIVSAHAPCDSASRTLDEIRDWWIEFDQILSRCDNATWFFCGIDANAPITGPLCEQFGTKDAEVATETGALFQKLLVERDLIAPSTFEGHEGPSGTWRHPRGMWLRRDYLVVSRSTLNAVARSYTITNLDTGFGHVDHIPVALTVRGFQANGVAPYKLRWDFDKLNDPYCLSQFQEALRTMPMPNHVIDIDTHATLFEGQLMQLAQQYFAPTTKKPRSRPVLQDSTVALIQQKRQALQMFRLPAFSDCPILRDEIKRLDQLVKPKVASDQIAWYDDWLVQIQHSGAIHDHRTMFAKLQRLGRKKKAQPKGPRPLPMLCQPSGEVTSSFVESQELFLGQFSKIEAGIRVNDCQLRQLHKPSACANDIDLDLCPTPYKLLKQIRRMKNRKAPGPGGMVVEVLKAGGEVLCQHLVPLITKAILHQQEPLHWKSGLLIPLFKGKGSTRCPQSYRSIFLSDCIAKVHHGVVRRRLAHAWNDHSDVIQYGGKRGYGTDLAHHILSAFVAWGRASNTSVGLLFVDLQSAFYSVLRESFFEGQTDDHLICHAMQHHGILPQDWHQMRAQIEQDAALAKVGSHAQHILTDMFAASHFSMIGISDQVCTTRGTRPGDPVADIIFNMVFYLVMRDTREQFRSLTGLPWLGHPDPPADITRASSLPSSGFCDVSFVDDAAYCVHTDAPERLGPAMQCLASCLHDVARLRGLNINYTKGKTEAMMHLAGAGCRKVRTKLWHDQKGRVPVVTEHGTSDLQVVHEYKHLGSYIQDFAVNTKDARFRVAQAKQAASQLQKSFFGKRNVSVHTKASIFQSLVGARHVYQAHTWSWITDDEVSQWNAGLRTNIAQIVRSEIRPIPAFKFSVEHLYAFAHLNAPRDLLHANRLRYFARVISKAPTLLWQLLYHTSVPKAWPKLLVESFAWLRKHSARVIPELTDFADICGFVSLHQRWNGIIKAALKSCLSFYAADAKGLLWNLRMEHFVQHWSDFTPPSAVTMGCAWQCGLCDMRFDSKRALAMHSRKVHQYRRWQKYFALDVDCLACGKRYFARSRLMSHLTTSHHCACIYKGCFPPISEDAVIQIEDEERERTRALRAQGWKASKAFFPVLQLPYVALPPPGSEGALLMRGRWSVRNGGEGEAFNNMVGFATHADEPETAEDFIVPFLGQTCGGREAGHSGVFQMYGLASLHAQIHIKALVFVHFYSGFRRHGDLQWQIEQFQVNVGTQLLTFLGDLLSAATLSGLCGFAEHPAYPTWAMKQNPPSIWTLPAFRHLARLQCVEIVTFDQCLLGHESRKPTTLLLLRMRRTSDLLRARGLGGRCNHNFRHQALKGRDEEGNFRTSSAKIYPILLNEILAQGVLHHVKVAGIKGQYTHMPCELQPLISADIQHDSKVQADYHG
eukprot:s1935_g3.t1